MKINNFLIVVFSFLYVNSAKSEIKKVSSLDTVVPVEIRFCSFPNEFGKGKLFINDKKIGIVKSNGFYVQNFPINSDIHIRIRLGKTDYYQDGYYQVEKNGGVINVDYFFNDSLSMEKISNDRKNQSGWISVDYWPGLVTHNPPKVKYKLIPRRALVGDFRDRFGCLTTAGYQWSDAAQSCVRLWEVGDIIESSYYDSTGLSISYGYVIFSENGEYAEIFPSENWMDLGNKNVYLLRNIGYEWRYIGEWRYDVDGLNGYDHHLNLTIHKNNDNTPLKLIVNNTACYFIKKRHENSSK